MSESLPIKTSRSKTPPKGWVNARRGAIYKAPPPNRFRRLVNAIFNRYTLGVSLLMILVGFLTFTYFWFEYSDQIDRKLLSGEVFTPTAGIYSAPKTLRVDEAISQQGLIDYLKSAGYIDKSNKADISRSRFSIEGDVVTIDPGQGGIIDGKKVLVGRVGPRPTQRNPSIVTDRVGRPFANVARHVDGTEGAARFAGACGPRPFAFVIAQRQENNEVLCREFIISGGVRDFLDGYYWMNKLQASAVYGQASGFLKYAAISQEALDAYIESQVRGLQLAHTYLKVK